MSGGSGSNPSGGNMDQRISGQLSSNHSLSHFLKDLRRVPSSFGKRSANSNLTNSGKFGKIINISRGGGSDNNIVPFTSMNSSDVNMRQSFIYKSNPVSDG